MKHSIIIATDELLSEMDALQIRGGVGEVQGSNIWKCVVNEEGCIVYAKTCPSKTSKCVKSTDCEKSTDCPAPVYQNCINPHKLVGCNGLV